MSTYAEKKEENQNDASNHLNTSSEAEASMVSTDHRSEAVSQMKLQEMADNSSKVKQLKVYQQMADDHSETQEKSIRGEVTQLNAFRFARMAAPMAKRALQFGAGAGTAMGLADAGLDAKKKYDKGDNLGAAMSAGGALTGLLSSRFGYAASAMGNFRDGDYGQGAINTAGAINPKIPGLSMLTTGITAKNLGDKIPFVNNPAEQDSSNDMMGWWLKNNMAIPENYLQTFNAAVEGGASHEKASELANKTLDGDSGLV